MRDSQVGTGSGAGTITAAVYALITFLMLIQQPGATTYDTRAELTQRPGDFLSGAFSLWHPGSNFGEFQNQAYGYLFPQGSWFLLGDLLNVPDWISQRLWGALILVIACEGARRVARAIGLGDLAALVAGVVFALSPRLLGTVTVQTAESLPGAVMPWLVLAVVLHLRGRLAAWPAALLSGAAVVCMGGVNAVETAGSLPLAILLVLWGARRGLTSWRFVAGWGAAMTVACLWWALPLLVLARYAPPFYEYVESAGDTTSLIGWSESVRGDSSWLGYLAAGDQPWWPAAFALTNEPLLIVVAGLIAAIGLTGLVLMDSDLKRPLMLAAVIGLGCLTVAHGGAAGAPVADAMRSLLDGTFQIFRNVHKIDPVVRLPLALGFGCSVAWALQRILARWPRLVPSRGLLVLVPLALVLTLGQPFLLNDARTPGWDTISAPWQQARSYLKDATAADTSGHPNRTLVVPGASFALQDWGWTIDEPLAILGGTSTVSRSQVPLIPGESIRYLAALDQSIVTGRATEDLVDQLARAGITHVVLRRDLLRGNTRSPHPGGAAVSLARAGLDRVAGFGSSSDGQAEVEVFSVPDELPTLRTVAVEDVATVRGAPDSVLGLQGNGLLDPSSPTVLEGEPGWDRDADIVTDSNQRRERAFGNNDEGVSALMTRDEPWRAERAAHDFPAGPGEDQVVARYDGLRSLTASSAQGYADNYGPITVQSAPYAAIDGSLDTQWVTSVASPPEEQWLRLELSGKRRVHHVTVTPVADDPRVVPIRQLEIVAGDQRVRAAVSASGAPVTVDLDGSAVSSVEVHVVEAATRSRLARVGLREVEVDGLTVRRTAELPGVAPAGAPILFGVTPGRRACNVALTAPDCDLSRVRSAEEGGGMDRTFTTESAQRVALRGHVVVRGTPEAALLLDPVQRRAPVRATSAFGQDPRVSARFAYDGQPTTAWVSDESDLYPTLTLQWRRPRTISGITVKTGGVRNAPVAAVVTAPTSVQQVALGNDGTVALEPIRTRTLQIRFEKSPDASHVVVPELELTGVRLTRPFLADAPTGAVCGFGPTLRVDGAPVATRVRGTVADVVNGSPLAFEACELPPEGTSDGADLEAADESDQPARAARHLSAGTHRLVAQQNAEFEMLDLVVVPEGAGSPPPDTRAVQIEQWGSSERTASVASGPESILHLPENFNDGWTAEVDGEPLQAVRVDGWQQGWVLPASGAVTVELRYAPEQAYDVVLPLGLAASGSVLLGGIGSLVLLALRRRRSAPADPAPWPVDGRPGRAAWVIAAAATLLLLGPAAAVGLLIGGILGQGRARPVVLGGAAALIAGSGVLDALSTAPFVSGTAELCAAVAVGGLAGAVLAGAVLSGPVRVGRRRAVAP